MTQLTSGFLSAVSGELTVMSAVLLAQETTLAAAVESVRTELDTVAGAWSGPRATTVLTKSRASIDAIAGYEPAIASVRGTVSRWAFAAAEFATELAVREIALGHLATASPAVSEEVAARRRVLYGQIAGIAAEWQRTCTTFAAELDGAAAKLAPAGTAAAVELQPYDIAQAVVLSISGDASEVASWWATLTPERQATLVGLLPAVLGNLNGLPAAVRDAANRQQLADDLARLEAKEAAGLLTHLEVQVLENARAARDMIDSHELFQDPLTDDLATAQLYVYQPAAFGGDGRVAVSIGDLDSAVHIAVTVPGLLSDANGLDSAKSQNLYWEARWASHEGVAILDWMGYDAPSYSTADGQVPGGQVDEAIGDSLSEGLDIAGVVNRRMATAGAALLAADVAGINAMRRVDDPHLTVVGNSYGSTTSAIAADRFALQADDLVLSGSPGAGDAETVADLSTGAEHTWVASASTDFVSYLGESGGWDPADALADVVPGVEQMGHDPADDAFGANRMRAEYVDRNLDAHIGIPVGGPFEIPLGLPGDIDGHGHYYDVGSESLYNVAAVISGEYDLVTDADPRHKEPFVETHNPVDVDFDWDVWDVTPLIDDVDVHNPIEVNAYPIDPERERVPTDGQSHAP